MTPPEQLPELTAGLPPSGLNQPESGPQPATGPWPPTSWQQPGPYVKAAPGSTSRGRLVLVVAVALVGVLAATGAVGISRQYLNHPVTLSYSGAKLDQPEQTLRAAEAKVEQVIAHQPSTRSSNHHCYFALPDYGTKAERAEISDGIYCGPMLLISSVQANRFLHFPVSSDLVGTRIRLTPGQPSDETVALPAHERLARPDSSHQPASGAELQVPKAPAAAADAFVSVDAVGPLHSLTADRNVRMFGYDGGVQLVSSATTPYYGSQAQARSAASGQQLIAFAVQYGGPKNGSLSKLDLGVSVNESTLQKLPGLDKASDFKVISVPVASSSVDLVLRSKGFVQKISLLTGKAGSDNITVMNRINWADKLTVTRNVPITLHASDGSASGTMHLKVTEADLEFFEDSTGQSTPASPHDAFLHLEMSYTVDGISEVKGQELMPRVLSLRTSDGHVVNARDVDTVDSNYSYLAFEVPGDFTGGTVTVGGSDSVNGIELVMPQPFSFPVSFLAG